MSKLRGPKCPVCTRRIDNSKIPQNQPIRIFENCSKCAVERKIFTFTPIVVAILFAIKVIISGNLFVGEAGLLLGAIGSLLLINNLAKPLLAGTIYDGYEVVAKELPLIRYTNLAGFVLLSLSFITFLLNSSAGGSNAIAVSFDYSNIAWFELIIGALLGTASAVSYDYVKRPRIKKNSLSFTLTNVNFGKLVKLNFRLKGNRSPGLTSLLIKVGAVQRFAKWDENPNPVENDQVDKFKPELVPATYYLPIALGEEYSVPILVQPTNSDIWNIFSGWWFDQTGGYDSRMVLKASDTVELKLVGNSEIWTGKFSLGELIK